MSSHSVAGRRARTVAAAVALSLGAAGWGVAVASAASAPAPKPIKISPSAAPKIVDNPGTGKDVVRITNLPGVRWALTGDVAASWKTPFSSSEKFVDVPVTKNGTSVTVTAGVSDPTGTVLGSDISSWTLPFAITTSSITPAAPVALDAPGTAKDAVRLTGVKGVLWRVGTKDIPSFTGTKDFALTKLEIKDDAAKAVTVAATIDTDSGYAGTDTSTVLAFTSDASAPIAKATIDAAITDPSNLPGRSRDKITLSPVLGVKWSVCGGKPFSVTKPTIRSASCKTAAVPIKAIADKGYLITGGDGEGASYTKTVAFPDEKDLIKVAVANSAIQKTDRPGSALDSAELPVVRNAAWQYAFPATDKAGRVTWKWSNAPKAKAGATTISIKMKAPKTGDTATMFVRPVVDDDDFVLDGWAVGGDSQTDGGASITTSTADVDATITAPTATADLAVTLNSSAGVSAWTVERTMPPVSGKPAKVVKSTVSAGPYTAVTVAPNGATKITVTPALVKGYRFGEGALKTWTFPAPAAPAPDPAPAPAPDPAP